MSTNAKYEFLKAMEEAFEGRVGELANEANNLLKTLRQNVANDETFQVAAGKLERIHSQLVPCCITSRSEGRRMVVYA